MLQDSGKPPLTPKKRKHTNDDSTTATEKADATPSKDIIKKLKEKKKLKPSSAGSPSQGTCTVENLPPRPKKKKESLALNVAHILEQIESDNSSPGAEGAKVIIFH